MKSYSTGFRFQAAFGHYFEKQIASKKKKDILTARLAKESVNFLLQGNLNATEWLGYEHRGKRKYRKGDLRIIFAHCGECRSLAHQQYNGCEECTNNADDTLRFFAFGHRRDIYDVLSSHQVYRAP